MEYTYGELDGLVFFPAKFSRRVKAEGNFAIVRIEIDILKVDGLKCKEPDDQHTCCQQSPACLIQKHQGCKTSNEQYGYKIKQSFYKLYSSRIIDSHTVVLEILKFTPSRNVKNNREKKLLNFSAIYYVSMEYSRRKSEIIYTDDPLRAIMPILDRYAPGKIFVVTEVNVYSKWFEPHGLFADFPKIVLPSGEENKKIDSVLKVWAFLSQSGADRKSLLINVGGGMLTDLCGFAASAFKRGIDFINIPTTLLAQVDASVGGKTGINFHGLKNEIGTFCNPVAVVICTRFLETIDKPNLVSGFAEMIKHGLIFSPEHLAELMLLDPENPDYVAFREYIRHSVEIKEYFVENDPREKNIRKALNFGHTTGHAIESLAMEQNRPVLHGYAVAWGMIAELYLSAKVCGFPEASMIDLSTWLKKLYGNFELEKPDFERLIALMQHDKKNEADRINFTLLADTGSFMTDQYADQKLVFEGLEFLRDIQA